MTARGKPPKRPKRGGRKIFGKGNQDFGRQISFRIFRRRTRSAAKEPNKDERGASLRFQAHPSYELEKRRSLGRGKSARALRKFGGSLLGGSVVHNKNHRRC